MRPVDDKKDEQLALAYERSLTQFSGDVHSISHKNKLVYFSAPCESLSRNSEMTFISQVSLFYVQETVYLSF